MLGVVIPKPLMLRYPGIRIKRVVGHESDDVHLVRSLALQFPDRIESQHAQGPTTDNQNLKSIAGFRRILIGSWRHAVSPITFWKGKNFPARIVDL
ncbi:hypothetical protein [Maridesulfovibrio ferrireducens]|uniref:hypothetical protein n=1 Tax=Maridesulfovibrio ferrireducens TaxID=246191 RepID=UPI00147CE610|nr:hypothetical protein [Maridesulfovibrio ferrireducens]